MKRGTVIIANLKLGSQATKCWGRWGAEQRPASQTRLKVQERKHGRGRGVSFYYAAPVSNLYPGFVCHGLGRPRGQGGSPGRQGLTGQDQYLLLLMEEPGTRALKGLELSAEPAALLWAETGAGPRGRRLARGRQTLLLCPA